MLYSSSVIILTPICWAHLVLVEEMGMLKEYEVQASVVSSLAGLVEHCNCHSKLARQDVTLVRESVLNAGLGSVVDRQEGRHSEDL